MEQVEEMRVEVLTEFSLETHHRVDRYRVDPNSRILTITFADDQRPIFYAPGFWLRVSAKDIVCSAHSGVGAMPVPERRAA